MAERCRALVVGPGLGRASATTVADVRDVVARPTVPVVVDADGLYALGTGDEIAAVVGGDPGAAAGARGARTGGAHPPRGRVRPLGRSAAGARPDPRRRRAGPACGAVVLLKGPTTVVADPAGNVLLATAGSPRLATAGTGDVLSGAIGAFVARGVEPQHAAALAAHVHGRAAELGPSGGPRGGGPRRSSGSMAVGGPPGMSRAGVRHETGETAPHVGSRPVWAEIDLGAVRHNASLLRRGRGTGRAVCRGQGRRLRARCGPRGPSRPGGGCDLVGGGHCPRRAWSCAPPASPRPCSCCRSRPPPSMADVVAHGLTLDALLAPRHPGRRRGLDARRRRHRRPRQGGHGHAPRRRRAAPSWCRSSMTSPPSRPCASPPCGRTSPWPTVSNPRTVPSPRRQIRSLGEARDALVRAGHGPPLLHAANSAGALAYPASRLDLVRCGIALYGVSPFPVVDPAFAEVVAVDGCGRRCARCCRCAPR